MKDWNTNSWLLFEVITSRILHPKVLFGVLLYFTSYQCHCWKNLSNFLLMISYNLCTVLPSNDEKYETKYDFILVTRNLLCMWMLCSRGKTRSSREDAWRQYIFSWFYNRTSSAAAVVVPVVSEQKNWKVQSAILKAPFSSILELCTPFSRSSEFFGAKDFGTPTNSDPKHVASRNVSWKICRLDLPCMKPAMQ